MNVWKLCLFVFLLSFLSFGSVYASDDGFSFEPSDDTFVENDSDCICDDIPNFNNSLDDDFNYSDVDFRFFLGDSVLSIITPFSGGLKVGSQTLKKPCKN